MNRRQRSGRDSDEGAPPYIPAAGQPSDRRMVTEIFNGLAITDLAGLYNQHEILEKYEASCVMLVSLADHQLPEYLKTATRYNEDTGKEELALDLFRLRTRITLQNLEIEPLDAETDSNKPATSLGIQVAQIRVGGLFETDPETGEYLKPETVQPGRFHDVEVTMPLPEDQGLEAGATASNMNRKNNHKTAEGAGAGVKGQPLADLDEEDEYDDDVDNNAVPSPDGATPNRCRSRQWSGEVSHASSRGTRSSGTATSRGSSREGNAAFPYILYRTAKGPHMTQASLQRLGVLLEVMEDCVLWLKNKIGDCATCREEIQKAVIVCPTGALQAPVVAICFLMRYRSLTLLEAFDMVYRSREGQGCWPTPFAMLLLIAFEKSLFRNNLTADAQRQFEPTLDYTMYVDCTLYAPRELDTLLRLEAKVIKAKQGIAIDSEGNLVIPPSSSSIGNATLLTDGHATIDPASNGAPQGGSSASGDNSPTSIKPNEFVRNQPLSAIPDQHGRLQVRERTVTSDGASSGGNAYVVGGDL
ncbi:unnamed protein product [Amoebophrya sp. A120]|nr:unnamed protein product [Amoebophrya sp. A120]|eukprot:GSA120T00009622001.1